MQKPPEHVKCEPEQSQVRYILASLSVTCKYTVHVCVCVHTHIRACVQHCVNYKDLRNVTF